jgi:hypothetical protein
MIQKITFGVVVTVAPQGSKWLVLGILRRSFGMPPAVARAIHGRASAALTRVRNLFARSLAKRSTARWSKSRHPEAARTGWSIPAFDISMTV